MISKDRFLIFGMMIAALGFALAAAHDYLKSYHMEKEALASQVLDVDETKVIGDHPSIIGDIHSTYILVEFGDYQCPPCRRTNKLIPEVLDRYHGKLRFEFRNLPLVSIHPLAMRAAIIAAEAHEHGKFWSVHDRLYSGTVTGFGEGNIQAAIHSLRIANNDMPEARNEVARDLAEANLLGLHSTPSFILCGPRNKVVHLLSIDQVGQFIDQ